VQHVPARIYDEARATKARKVGLSITATSDRPAVRLDLADEAEPV
jgi:hypothetical protein